MLEQPDGNTVVFKGAAGLVVLDTGRHLWQRQAMLADLATIDNGDAIKPDGAGMAVLPRAPRCYRICRATTSRPIR